MSYGSSKTGKSHLKEESGLTIANQQTDLNYLIDSESLKEKLDSKNTEIKVLADILSHQISGRVATMKGLMELINSLPPNEVKEYLPLLNLVIEQMDKAVKDVTASAFDAAD